MKRALAVALLVLVALAFAFAFPVTSGGSSGYTTTTGNFNDSAGNPLASGQVSFTPTDGHGNAISYQTSNGQTIKSPVSCTVTAGAVASGCKVADTTLTTPLNLCYLTQGAALPTTLTPISRRPRRIHWLSRQSSQACKATAASGS
jgi:hypothetical protein